MVNPIIKQEREEKYQEKVRDYLDSVRFLIQIAPEQARYHRATFDAHIAEGFTPEQALLLTKG
jgi:hypothetical protein